MSFGFCKETTWSTVSGLGGSTGNLPTSAHARRMEVGSERSEGVFRITVFSVSGLSVCFLSLSFVYCAGAVLVSYWDKRSHFALVVTCRHLPTLPRSYLSTRSCLRPSMCVCICVVVVYSIEPEYGSDLPREFLIFALKPICQ